MLIYALCYYTGISLYLKNCLLISEGNKDLLSLGKEHVPDLFINYIAMVYDRIIFKPSL